MAWKMQVRHSKLQGGLGKVQVRLRKGGYAGKLQVWQKTVLKTLNTLQLLC